MKKRYVILVAIILIASSCNYNFPENEILTAGNANFDKVVAVGNSLTAGFMNGALYDEGQKSSYANLVAQQMEFVGGGDFKQPDINSKNGVILQFLPAKVGRLKLTFKITAQGPTRPSTAPIGVGDYPMSTYSGSLNNFGVPGMRIIEIGLDGYGQYNPYFARFASAPNTSVLKDAMAANGTFIIFWLGSNDVLKYAMEGAAASANGINANDMTPLLAFEKAYKAALNTLTDGKKGIVANIPNIKDLPYFTTIAWNSIPLDEATANFANMGFAEFNKAIKAYNEGKLPGLNPASPPAIKRNIIKFNAGNNGIVMVDKTLPDLSKYKIPSIRQATKDDLITLLAATVVGTLANPTDITSLIGVGTPLEEKYTLITAEQKTITTRIKEFNAVISAAVKANGENLALLDMNSIFSKLKKKGVTINGVDFNTSITPPFGGFSLDGIHLNPRGSAYVANLFINKINETFRAKIPLVNPNNYSGNENPQLVQ